MVYVFYVQPGEMMTYDDEEFIMQSVQYLKEKITERCSIATDQQVLLINGGEPLDNQKNLCSYMAGTDTNPIYLFSTNFEPSTLEILKALNYDDTDIRQRLLDCQRLPVSLNTVKSRALVAQEFYNVAKLQQEYCDKLVYEQHLQQQGWSAVIANLEDIVSEFKKRWDLFFKAWQEFLSDKAVYKEFLESFEEDKQVLQKIPVIRSLLETEIEEMDSSKQSETDASESEPIKDLTLFEWISGMDNKNSLDELYALVKSSVHKFEEDIMPYLENQITETLTSAEKTERKEIDGLDKRLFTLEELLVKIKKHVDHQNDMAQSFQQNQTRASHIRDMSILPDLCATHLQQLEYIRKVHEYLMEDRSKIIRAKNELSKSLCARIGWVQSIENKLWELDSMLVYFHDHLHRLRSHLEVFQQLHLSPEIYMSAVIEVVRRRQYSQYFVTWASNLACQQLTHYNEELTRRKDFASQFKGHFLNLLFPGMEDVPPPFATEAPSMFDSKLPRITMDDVEKLKNDVPDLAKNLTLIDISQVIKFFRGRACEEDKRKDNKVDDVSVEEKINQAVSDIDLESNFEKNEARKKATNIEKGCESETDTEEFEKVGQSPLELNFPQGQGAIPKVFEKQDASTSTADDKLQVSKTEHDRVKSIILDLGTIAKQVTSDIRTELDQLKSQYLSESLVLRSQYEDLGSSWENLVIEIDRNEKELVESMRRQQETEREDFRYRLLERDHVIQQLKDNNTALTSHYDEACKELSELKEKMEQSEKEIKQLILEKDQEKERCLRELSEQLKSTHKAELDNVKSRFKLMTTMDRSPSLSSLEKMAGENPSSPGSLSQSIKMKDIFKTMQEQKEALIGEVAQRVIDDKDKQIDILREREKNLSLEVIKLKTTIQQLAETEAERDNSELLEEIAVLKRERTELREELEKLKSEKEAMMSASIAVCEGKSDATTSPLEMSSPAPDMSRSEISVSKTRPHRLNIDTCKVGDIVLVLWDATHKNFKILQESRHAYFLHSACLEKLGLWMVDGKPNKLHCTGEVIDKEYCHARKSENRYKVPKGTKFFQVKVKPAIAPLRETSQSTHYKQQIPVMSSSQSAITIFDPVLEEDQSPLFIDNTLATLDERQLDERTLVEVPTTARTDSESSRMDVLEQPEELRPQSVDKTFAEDSGIVENVEQATVALEDSGR